MVRALSGSFRIENWLVDPAGDTISRPGETVKLEPRTMRLLLCLADASGAVVSQERLLADVWTGVVVGSASVYQAISQLRRLLGRLDNGSEYIVTVPRKGYRLAARVEPLPSGALPTPPAPASTDLPALIAQRPLGLRGGLWSLFMVAAVVLVLRLTLQPAGQAGPVPHARSIIVLPLVDHGGEASDSAYCDGLTEEISSRLAQIPALKVASPSAALQYQGATDDIRAVGHAFGASHVLIGSLRRSGDDVRLGIQLIDASTGYRVWSSVYDRPLEDAIRIQEDITHSVAGSLKLDLSEETIEQFAERRTDNPEAYRQYLLARHDQRSRAAGGNAQAMQHFRRSLELDPTFALAYVGLAGVSVTQMSLEGRPISEISALAETLLTKAAQLDPELPELYTVRASLREKQGQDDEALADLGHAVSLNPNDSGALAELGRLFSAEGRPRDALPALQRAVALNPFDNLLYANECVVLQDLARFAQADAACERARSLHGESNWCAVASAWLAQSQGDLAQAVHWGRRALSGEPRDVAAYERVADYLLTVGETSAARNTFNEARSATHDEARVRLGLAGIAFFESGPAGLREQLQVSGLERFTDSRTLIDSAYLHLLLGEPDISLDLMHRALRAPDFDTARLNSPWFARWGQSDLLVLAAAELMSGRKAEGQAHLQQIAQLIERLIDSGEERGGIYALQAQVQALQGRDADAMRSLLRAVDLGWRAVWLAEHEPYFASLSARSDFQSLMARVEQANRRVRVELDSEL